MKRLPFYQFAAAILQTSLGHGLLFAMLMSIVASIYTASTAIGSGQLLLSLWLYTSSYGVHELGHYMAAQRLHAAPVLWIDRQSVSVLSQPLSHRDGKRIAVAGPLMAVVWLLLWWVIIFSSLPAYRFVVLIPVGLIASAHLGNLLPGFSDGKAVRQVRNI